MLRCCLIPLTRIAVIAARAFFVLADVGAQLAGRLSIATRLAKSWLGRGIKMLVRELVEMV